jgi:hypothetical protein
MFLRSASRNSATVLASTPALRAPRAAVREVVLAALRAFCWRPRACPPFLAAAVRFADDDFELDERALEERLVPDDDLLRLDDALVRPDDDLLPDDERLRELAAERLDPLAFFLPPEPPLLRRSAMSSSPS